MIRILVERSPGEERVAVVDGGALLDFAVWRPGAPDGVGDVYRARVAARIPAMAGAFVRLPEGDGFLPESEGSGPEGSLIGVRIVRAGQGGKGPRLAAAEVPPGLAAELVRRGPTPLEEAVAAHPKAKVAVGRFEAAVADAVAGLSEPEMALPGRMRASIHPTPALVAIDLDLAAGTAARVTKATAQMAANLAALPALARQIRLRNLSGAILIDPAGLGMSKRAKLGPALSAALAEDPLEPRLLGFTALGLAEIVRRRVRPPLHEVLAGPHAAGLAALREIDRESEAAPHLVLGLSCSPEVAAALGNDRVALDALAARTGRQLVTRPDPQMPANGWRIERTP